MDKSRILKIVEFGYLIYALFAMYVIFRIIGKINTSIGQKELSEIPFSNFMPLIVLGLIALVFIVLILILAYFLNKRIHRIASLVLSIILAVFPIGTLLGIITVMLLTRKDIQEQFTS
jgi:amino acid transporter